MSDPIEQLRQRFLGVAAERVERLVSGVLELERTPGDGELAKATKREAHTLKGEASMLGFEDVEARAHAVEDQLAVLATDPEAVQAALTLLDEIAALVGAKPPARRTPEPAVQAEPVQGPDEHLRVPVARVDQLTALVSDLAMHAEEADRVHERMITGLETLRRQHRRLGHAVARAAEEERRAGRSGGVLADLVRMVAVQRALIRDLAELPARQRESRVLQSAALQTAEDTVRTMRFVPLDSVFHQFRRAVRDIARDTGKRVELHASGGAVELDKSVLDRVSDPLLHLVRNAVDHGIEPTEERRRQGKPETANVTIAAELDGPMVRIEVADDGRGIDAASVRAALVEHGEIEATTVDAMDDGQVLSELFRPGFSTRRSVTRYSGRGVGLAVVQQAVAEVGGSVQIETARGRGTTFRIALPTSTAFSRALVVVAGDEHFALPSPSVRAALRVPPHHVIREAGSTALAYDGHRIPLVDLADLLDLAPNTDTDLPVPIALLDVGGELLGLRIQRHVGEHPVQLQQLDPFLRGLPYVSGTATLPDRRTAFALDPGELLVGSTRAVRTRTQRPKRTARNRVLVVEDSEFTRDMLVASLRRGGFRVDEAVDGRNALERFRAHPADLVLTDLDMPIMDGFALVRALRELPQARALPIVVLTTRGASEDKRRAAQAGADAYLVKSEFDEQILVDTLRRLLPAAEAPGV